ncbi:BZIP Maf transcription factor [Paragonimus heterotremus]|uniref:BZIP Maf transcription factor n=1 Tax=Paragonimus heterotremus TaxID=100268 RepID=A0A8J4T9L8_9TREM|nr:BZIP Maf transcription factor [Paragonimus heterotremus]
MKKEVVDGSTYIIILQDLRVDGSTMDLTITDDELVCMSTSDLRAMLQKHLVTTEEHRQLRNRRRRLQNRKYARKCALKKLTEVENLVTEVKEETVELQTLRRQLNRISLATRRIQHQEAILANFCHQLQSSSDQKHMLSAPISSVRMLFANGQPAGIAQPIRLSAPPTATSSPACRISRDDSPESISTNSPHWVSVQAKLNSMPMQLAAGPGMPSSTSSFYSAWPPTTATQLDPRLPLHLVRPVGCGLATYGHSMPEF